MSKQVKTETVTTETNANEVTVYGNFADTDVITNVVEDSRKKSGSDALYYFELMQAAYNKAKAEGKRFTIKDAKAAKYATNRITWDAAEQRQIIKVVRKLG